MLTVVGVVTLLFLCGVKLIELIYVKSCYHFLVLANVLSALRGVLAVLLLGMFILGAANFAIVSCGAVMWVTDFLDGWFARKGMRQGALQRMDGQIIDPLMDNIAFFVGFIILLDAAVVPLWFVGLLFVSRVLFSVVRMIGLANQEKFAKPQFSTKLSGACLGFGQCLLFVNIHPDSLVISSTAVNVVVYIMTVVLGFSLYRFLFNQHRALLLGIFKSGGN